MFKNLTFVPLLRHYFVSLICFFSAWLQTEDDWQKIDQSTNQNGSSAGGRSQNLRLAEDVFLGRGFFACSPPPPPPRFVTRTRPIFARVQDGVGDRKLRVSQDFSAIKTPTNRLKVGSLKTTRTKILCLFSNSFHLWAIKIYSLHLAHLNFV